MKKKIIIANWKMSLSQAQALALTQALLESIKDRPLDNLELVVCPSFNVLSEVGRLLAKSNIALGAQDCCWEEAGAYTGEVSPQVLKEIGCQFVILGHSERRKYLGESDQLINSKVKSALKNGLAPILCVGETFEERQAGNKDFVIMQQLEKGLSGVNLGSADRLVIAYEPVWVIGSGQAVAAAEAEHTNQVVRQVLLDHFAPQKIEEQIHLIYGGSVNPENIKEFMLEPTIAGALVGGASLEAKTFSGLIAAAQKAV